MSQFGSIRYENLPGGTSFSQAHEEESLTEKAKTMVSSAAEKAQEIGSTVAQRAQDAASSVADTAQEYASAVGHRAQEMGEDATDLIRRYPLQSLCVGFCVGFLVARLVRNV